MMHIRVKVGAPLSDTLSEKRCISIHRVLFWGENHTAGIFDPGYVLLNQNVNGSVCTHVNHNGTDNIGSGFVQDWFGGERIILV